MAVRKVKKTLLERIEELSGDKITTEAITTNRQLNQLFTKGLTRSNLYLTKYDIENLTIGRWLISNDSYRKLYSDPFNMIVHSIFYGTLVTYVASKLSDLVRTAVGDWDENRLRNMITSHLAIDIANNAIIIMDNRKTVMRMPFADYNENLITQVVLTLELLVTREINVVLVASPTSPYATHDPNQYIANTIGLMLSENEELKELVQKYQSEKNTLKPTDRAASDFLRVAERDLILSMSNLLIGMGIRDDVVSKVFANSQLHGVYETNSPKIKNVRQIAYTYIVNWKDNTAGEPQSAILEFTCGDIIDLVNYHLDADSLTDQAINRIGSKFRKNLDNLANLFKTAGLEYISAGAFEPELSDALMKKLMAESAAAAGKKIKAKKKAASFKKTTAKKKTV